LTESDYRRWISLTGTGGQGLGAMRRQVVGLEYLPLVSLALVVSDHDEVWIKSTLDSVLKQVYPRLELCVCDNGSVRPHVPEVLGDYATADERVKVRRLPGKESWAGAYNEALSIATGEFVALIEAGDEISPEALFRMVEILQHVSADVIYTDEDRLDVGGRRSDPVFKPYWSPDLLLSTAYVGRLCAVRRSVLQTVGPFREGYEGAEEHDLALRLSERTDRIRHLPEVLYHRRRLLETPDETRERPSRRVIQDALARREVDAAVEPGLVDGSFRVVRLVAGRPGVSVIVHAPEGWTDFSIVDRLEQQTDYPIHRIIEARVGRLEHPSAARVSHPFPTRALNLAAGEAGGEYLAFVDARAQMKSPGWLREMLSQAQRPEVGVVGCKLLDPSGVLRHGGSQIGMSRLTGDPEEPVSEGGNYLPLTDHAFNFGAASARCMMVRRAAFEGVGGFDGANLPNGLYDLDLSFRLRESGLLNVYTPHAQVVCDDAGNMPYTEEIKYVWSRWWAELVRMLHYRKSPLHPAHHGLEKEALFVLPS
jgi:glycosyltransferase involved in cell wall biosynthesis